MRLALFQKQIASIAIVTTLAVIFLFIMWRVFESAPTLFYLSPWPLCLFLFSVTAGVFSFGSPSQFPFVLSLAPILGGRRRRASLRTFAAIFATALSSVLLFLGMREVGSLFQFFLPLVSPAFPILLLVALVYAVGLAWVGCIPMNKMRFFARTFLPQFSANTLGVFTYNGISYFLDVFPYLWLALLSALLTGNELFIAYIIFGFFLARVFIPSFVSLHTSFRIDRTEWLAKERFLGTRFLGTMYLILSPLLLYTLLYSAPLLGYRTYVFADVLVPVLWMIPLWVSYLKASSVVFYGPVHELGSLLARIDDAREEQHQLSATSFFSSSRALRRIAEIDAYLKQAYLEAAILDSGARHGLSVPLRSTGLQKEKEKFLAAKLSFTILSSLLILFIYHVYL